MSTKKSASMARKSIPEKVEKKERLTLSALASYDDVLTDALVDSVRIVSDVQRSRPNLCRPSIGQRFEKTEQSILLSEVLTKMS